MKKKLSKKEKLPPYVVVTNGRWYVRREFPTSKRTAKGRIVYMQIKRRCEIETPEAAKAIADFIEQEYYGNALPPIEEQTVAENVAHYLATKRRSVTRRTFESMEMFARLYIASSEFGRMPITAVKVSHVQAFYNSLELTPSVLQKLHKLLSSSFNQAVKWDDLPKNPCSGAVVPPQTHKDLKAFDNAQARAFIAECQKTNRHIVLEFAIETGARPGEYLALSWDDVDLKKCLVHIRRAFASGFKGGGFEIKEPKTRGSRRTIQISPQLRDRLLAQKGIVEEMKEECRLRIAAPLLLKGAGRKGVNYQNRKASRKVAQTVLANLEHYNLVFPSERGLPHSINNLNRRDFKATVAAIGLDPSRYSLYSLRHTATTLSLSAGVNIKAMAEKLGHSGVEVLLTTYAHVLPNMKKETADKLAEALY